MSANGSDDLLHAVPGAAVIAVSPMTSSTLCLMLAAALAAYGSDDLLHAVPGAAVADWSRLVRQ